MRGGYVKRVQRSTQCDSEAGEHEESCSTYHTNRRTRLPESRIHVAEFCLVRSISNRAAVSTMAGCVCGPIDHW